LFEKRGRRCYSFKVACSGEAAERFGGRLNFRGEEGVDRSIQLYYPTPELIFSSNPHGYEQASHFPFPDTKTCLSNPVYINNYVN